ncbi:DMT family transporter [Acinetobacter rudis]|uniref:DMT family transporter n=1 Tax=Acinetobacter rudis TaxID=632955 RepID=A0AAW8J839_9GAMM|nr:DMT family transporter [Acinetobacter rudis]MDQ8935324.1 DMT family transporter [Acinetobacter rudis]MDQ8952788.1 DMT family transporter [Acinetobacter rudis]MDQ9017481.1 DMT family transporter [Acinetobacter rudis]
MSNTSRTWIQSNAPQLSLLFMTLIWGGTFIVVQYALNYSTPMFFVGCRFAAAALAVSLLYWRELRGITQKDWIAGLMIGASIAGGYGMQTIGLQSISSSESAFLTALYVPLVPILLWIIFRKAPYIMTWIGVIMAFFGLILLTGNGLNQLHFNFGQIITLIGSISIALEIIFIGYFSKHVNLARVTVLQLIFASLVSFASMPIIGEVAIPAFSWPLLLIAAGLGCASAFIQLVMNWAQRFVDPTQAAIIYAAEPVWAGIIGRIAGERLPFSALVGGMLVVLAVIVSQINPKFLQRKLKIKEPQ